MRPRTFAVLAAMLPGTLLAAGCSGSSRCPKPVFYTAEQYKQIGAAIKDLPKDSIIRQILEDYETERDELRFCK